MHVKIRRGRDRHDAGSLLYSIRLGVIFFMGTFLFEYD